MMRANLMALAGASVSILSVVMLWFLMSFMGLGIGSGDTNLVARIDNYTAGVSVLYVVGAILALWTQLGVLLQLPGLVFFPFVLWYRDYSTYWMFGYVVALVGTALSIHSCFVEVTMPGRHLRIPPESRIRVWFLWKDEHKPMLIPRKAKYVIESLIVAAIVIASGIVMSAYARPMSKISVTTYINGDQYGAVDLTVKLDDLTVATKHIEPASGSPSITIDNVLLDVTAGSHEITVDVTSNTYPQTNNLIDYFHSVKVLPFTTEEVQVGIGVGFM